MLSFVDGSDELARVPLDGAAVADLRFDGTISVRLDDGRTQTIALP